MGTPASQKKEDAKKAIPRYKLLKVRIGMSSVHGKLMKGHTQLDRAPVQSWLRMG